MVPHTFLHLALENRVAELKGNIEKNAIQNAKILRARQAAAKEVIGSGEKETSLRTPVSARL